MTQQAQAEALMIADYLDRFMPGLIRMRETNASAELRRLHARVQELEAQQAAPHMPEPEAYLFQHEETGRTMFVDAQQVEWGFEANNPRLQNISGVYTEHQVRTMLAAQAAPGWKLVPCEPDAAMVEAGRNYPTLATGCYKAMIAASPTPTNQETK